MKDYAYKDSRSVHRMLLGSGDDRGDLWDVFKEFTLKHYPSLDDSDIAYVYSQYCKQDENRIPEEEKNEPNQIGGFNIKSMLFTIAIDLMMGALLAYVFMWIG